jgi:hypothetical protein
MSDCAGVHGQAARQALNPPGGCRGDPRVVRVWVREKFIADAYKDWQKHGLATLQRMREPDPSGYVRVIAGILPDKLEVDVRHEIKRIEWAVVDNTKVIEHEPSVGMDVDSASNSANSLVISTHEDGDNDPVRGGGVSGRPPGCPRLGP